MEYPLRQCSRESAGFVEDLKESGVKDQEYYFLERDQKNGLIVCCAEWTVTVRDSDCSSSSNDDCWYSYDGGSRSSTHRSCGASTTASGTEHLNSYDDDDDCGYCYSGNCYRCQNEVVGPEANDCQISVHEQQDGHHCLSEGERTLGSIVFAERSPFTRHLRQRQEKESLYATTKCFSTSYIDEKVLSRGRWS